MFNLEELGFFIHSSMNERMDFTCLLIKTCLLSEPSGFLSPTAGSTTTCVMYSFRVSERHGRERLISTVEN